MISSAVFGPFASQGDVYADRLRSAIRKQFGGHHEKTRGGS